MSNSNYLRLKKNNYLAVIAYTGVKKMVEIVAKDEEEAYEKAEAYAINVCKANGYLHFNPVIVKIPDCITVIK